MKCVTANPSKSEIVSKIDDAMYLIELEWCRVLQVPFTKSDIKFR